MADIDRDGRDDVVLLMYGAARTAVLIVRLKASGIVVDEMPNPGEGIYLNDLYDLNESYGFLWSFVTLLDHDGDGHVGYTQIGARGPTDSFLEIVEPTADQPPARLVAVHDGQLNPTFEGSDLSEVRIAEPMLLAPPVACGVDEESGVVEDCGDQSWGAGIVRECESAYPLRCVRSGMWVASALEIDDGIGGRIRETLEYSDARVDERRGVGLGFSRVVRQRITPGAEEVVETVFDLSRRDILDADGNIVDRRYPFAGQVLHEDRIRWPDGGASAWPAVTGRVVIERSDFGRSLQLVSDGVPTGLAGPVYRGLQKRERVRIYEAGNWKPGASVEEDELIHHWVTDYRHDTWGTATTTIAVDELGDTSTFTTDTVSNSTETFRIGQLDRREIVSLEGVFARRREIRYSYTDRDSCGLGETCRQTFPELKTIAVIGDADEGFEVTLGHDGFGHVTSISRAAKNPDVETRDGEEGTLMRASTAEYERDEYIFVEAQENALGHRTTFEFFPETGALGLVKDPNGVAEEWVYDGFGVLVEHRHDGVVDRMKLLPATDLGCYRTESAPHRAPRTVTTFDCLGRAIRSTEERSDGRRSFVSFEYSSAGNLVRQTRPAFAGVAASAHQFEHDGLGRVRSSRNPDGTSETWTHQRRVVSYVNARGGLIETEFDTMGRTAVVKEHFDDGSTAVAKHGYGAFSQLRGIDRNGATTEFDHDGLGHLTRVRTPDGGERTMVYSGLGELESIQTFQGVRDLDYDLLGRLEHVREPDGATADWTFDAMWLGGVATTHRTGGADVWTFHGYDEYGRPKSVEWKIDGVGFGMHAAYDGGALRGLGYTGDGLSAPIEVAIDLDDAGRVNWIDASGFGRVVTTRERIDPLGRATSVDRGMRVERGFDPDTGRVEFYEATHAGSVVDAHSYTYQFGSDVDTDFDVLRGRENRYVQDKHGRLVEHWIDGVQELTYRYDVHGNQTAGLTGERDFDLDGRPHTLDRVGGVTFDHDSLGRRTRSSQGWEADYTAFDLPNWIRSEDGSVTSYGYDAGEARVVERHASGLTVFRIGDLRQVREGSTVLETTVDVHFEGDRVAELIERSGVRSIRWLSESPLGTTAASLEGGRVRFAEPSDSFGGTKGSGQETWAQFAGHEYELKSPLVNAQGRIYDPDNAVFLSPDPVIFATGQGANPYQYAFWNPHTFTDPTGFTPDACGSCGAGTGAIPPVPQSATLVLPPSPFAPTHATLGADWVLGGAGTGSPTSTTAPTIANPGVLTLELGSLAEFAALGEVAAGGFWLTVIGLGMYGAIENFDNSIPFHLSRDQFIAFAGLTVTAGARKVAETLSRSLVDRYKGQRYIFVTYTAPLLDGTMYAGRTSGRVRPGETDAQAARRAMNERWLGHHMLPSIAARPEVDQFLAGYMSLEPTPEELLEAFWKYSAIRGREDMLIDFYRFGAPTTGTGNARREIGLRNPLRGFMHTAAYIEFGGL